MRKGLGILSLIFLMGCGRGPSAYLVGSGTVEVREVRVGAQMSGQIADLRVDEGYRVAEGDTLAVLDHDLLLYRREEARAALEAARARLDLLRAGAREEDLAVARARVQEAEVQLRQARRDLERLERLYAERSATEKQVEDARLRLQLARAAHTAARETLRKLERGARPEEIRAAEAAVAQAEAALALVEAELDRAVVRAPISGTVTEKVLEQGELATPGMPLVTLANLEEAYLRIYLPEAELGRITLGQEVEVFIDTYPDRPFRGTITYISPEAEFTPKNVQTREERVKLVYEVKITIPNPEGILKPGMYADARIPR